MLRMAARKDLSRLRSPLDANARSAAPFTRKKAAAIQVRLLMPEVVSDSWLHPYRLPSVTATRIIFNTSLAVCADEILRRTITATPAARTEAAQLSTSASVKTMVDGSMRLPVQNIT